MTLHKSLTTIKVLVIASVVGLAFVASQPASAASDCAKTVTVSKNGVVSGNGVNLVKVTTVSKQGVTAPHYNEVIFKVKAAHQAKYDVVSAVGTDSRGNGTGQPTSPTPVFEADLDLTVSPIYVNGTYFTQASVCLGKIAS